jgi:hypothetical protein
MTSPKSLAARALEEGQGILRLAPTWVPRAFCRAGRRLKLHPDDYYALGAERGGIDERWLASTVRADNGPLSAENEGMSNVVISSGERLLLAEAIEELGADLIGRGLMDEHGGWTAYAKFFDNQGPLPFHVHPDDAHAALVGQRGKPEAYYFPPQMNNHGGDRPFSFLGLHPTATREQFVERIERFGRGDNQVTDLSQAYRLETGTGWDIPPGVLHAPGSFCTYEPQGASDVFAICECIADGRAISEDLLWKDVPADRRGDAGAILEIVDWDANIDPEFVRHRFMLPVRIESDRPRVCERWIVYRSPSFGAKELTLSPGTTATIRDAAAYGVIAVQGHGRLGQWSLESPTMIRYGDLTDDEFFVSEAAATAGVVVSNESGSEPLVLLKHFGPSNPDLPSNV